MRPKDIVTKGYDKISQLYNDERARSFWHTDAEVDTFSKCMPVGARVLDVGCGSGLVSSTLQQNGFRVTGIDVSEKMLELARKNSPASTFRLMDMRRLRFLPNSFDGVIGLYSIIHVPRRFHLGVLRGFRRVLKSKGFLAIHMGWGDYVGVEENWHGWGAALYWSHFDKEANLALLRKAGFQVVSSRRSGQKDGVHLFVIAQKPFEADQLRRG